MIRSHRDFHYVKWSILSAVLVAVVSPLRAASSTEQPNIVIVMADDLGWNHVGVDKPTLGTAPAVYQTPNLARLASQGLSFPFAYAQPNCAPTRAAMLSGQYAPRVHNDVYVVQSLNRFGRGGVSKQDAQFDGPPQHEDVAVEAITIAEALKKNGYATAHIGKYHVGGHSGPETLPENVGFDINIGGFQQGHQPTCFASRKDDQWTFKGVGRGDFDRWGEPYDSAYLSRRSLPTSLLGTPKHICDAVGDAVEETVSRLTAADAPFYMQVHTYAVHGPVKARPDLKQQAQSRADGQRKAEYLGFICGVDEILGRLITRLEDPNGDGRTSDSVLEKTVVFFTSDNGGTHATNVPLSGEKGMFAEGGIRVPLVAYWKGHIPADTVSDRMVHAVDYYPTCLALAGNSWKPSSDTHPLDGESFADELLAPGTHEDRGPICYLFPGYLDRRAQPGAWIIDEVDGKRYKAWYDYEDDVWSLFSIRDDVGEKKNLSTKNKKILYALAGRLDAWLTNSHPTWQPKYPISRRTQKSAGKPPLPE